MKDWFYAFHRYQISGHRKHDILLKVTYCAIECTEIIIQQKHLEKKRNASIRWRWKAVNYKMYRIVYCNAIDKKICASQNEGPKIELYTTQVFFVIFWKGGLSSY